MNGKNDGHPDVGEAMVHRLLHQAQDNGINFVDTAELYGDGEGEKRIGRALQNRRGDWVICSKFGSRKGLEGQRINDSSPQTIRSSLESSLRRLQTDYLDLFLFHVPPKQASLAEARDILDRLKGEGKIRAYGISTNTTGTIRGFLQHRCVEVVQFQSSLFNEHCAVRKLCQEHQLGAVIRGALASGRLSGRFFGRLPKFHSDDYRQGSFNPEDFLQSRPLQALLPEGWTMTQFAIRYLLDRTTSHTVLLGARHLWQYQEAYEALKLSSLREEHLKGVERWRKNHFRIIEPK
ncbi:MAG: aldo/keto reductase [Okeania sp. SIO1H5]|nr:aldo/keto reductase [Okeania sp. SIO1H5]